MGGKRAGRAHVANLAQRVEYLEHSVYLLQQAIGVPAWTPWIAPIVPEVDPEYQDAKCQKMGGPGEMTPPRKKSTSSPRNVSPLTPRKLELNQGSSAAAGAFDEKTSFDDAREEPKSAFNYKQMYQEKVKENEKLLVQLKAAEDCIKARVPETSDIAAPQRTESKEHKSEGSSLDLASIVREVVGHHIYCKRCYKSGPKCQCEIPFFTSLACRDCGSADCDCNAGFEEEIHSAGTAEECVICERLYIDDQPFMGCCSGQNCDAKSHCTCAGFDSVNSMEAAAWRCPSCVRNQVPVDIQLVSKTESCDEDEDIKTSTQAAQLESCDEDEDTRTSTQAAQGESCDEDEDIMTPLRQPKVSRADVENKIMKKLKQAKPKTTKHKVTRFQEHEPRSQAEKEESCQTQ